MLLRPKDAFEGFTDARRSMMVEELQTMTVIRKSPHIKNGRPPTTFARKEISTLIAERARFHRFIAARIGNAADADDLLQESLMRAIARAETLERGERVIAWFYRIIRNAIADYYRGKQRERRQVGRLLGEVAPINENSEHSGPPDWEKVLCACFRGLLPTMKPRYSELIRRIDLDGEDKGKVARELKMKPGTLDVALHRARYALRDRLEVMCGACSRESCLACDCELRARRHDK